jgi:hypothetical protein
MQALSHPPFSDRVEDWLLPFWTQVPGSGRMWVAAVVLAVAFVALIVGTRLRQAIARPIRRSQVRTVGQVDTSWFTAHALDGLPEEAVRAAQQAPNEPSLDRLYAAWVLATHSPGTSAEWLERNLALPADAAHLIVKAAEERNRERAEHESQLGENRGRCGGRR